MKVVSVTKQDDRIHKYKVPIDDCFAYLEVQFRFVGLSNKVEGVVGRIYRPDFKNSAKPEVAMPVVGGEDMYKTTWLMFADCKACGVFLDKNDDKESALIVQYGKLDCSSGMMMSSGNGIVCNK